MEHDLQLVKAAILYSDKVSLCSPMSNLLSAISSIRDRLEDSSFESKLGLLETLTRDYFFRPEVAELLGAYREFNRRKHFTPKELILKQKFIIEIKKAWKKFQEANFGLDSGVALKELMAAREAHVLDFLMFRDLSSADLAPKLLEQFTTHIHGAIKSLNTYPLLDDQTGALVKFHILTGQLQIDKAEATRGKQVGLAVSLFQKLPTFELATLKEIMDIRSELEKHLARFRSGMIKYSDSISSASWDENFAIDVEHVFLRDVEPCLKDIEDSIQSNSYLRQLTKRYTQHPHNFLLPTISVGVSNYLDLPQLFSTAFGLSPMAAEALDVLYDWREASREIKQNNLFFYYEAHKKLS